MPRSGVLESGLWVHFLSSLRLWKLCHCLLLTFLFVLQTPDFFNSSLWRRLFCLLMILAAFLSTFSDSIISLPKIESESGICHRMSRSHSKVLRTEWSKVSYGVSEVCQMKQWPPNTTLCPNPLWRANQKDHWPRRSGPVRIISRMSRVTGKCVVRGTAWLFVWIQVEPGGLGIVLRTESRIRQGEWITTEVKKTDSYFGGTGREIKG